MYNASTLVGAPQGGRSYTLGARAVHYSTESPPAAGLVAGNMRPLGVESQGQSLGIPKHGIIRRKLQNSGRWTRRVSMPGPLYMCGPAEVGASTAGAWAQMESWAHYWVYSAFSCWRLEFPV